MQFVYIQFSYLEHFQSWIKRWFIISIYMASHLIFAFNNLYSKNLFFFFFFCLFMISMTKTLEKYRRCSYDIRDGARHLNNNGVSRFNVIVSPSIG